MKCTGVWPEFGTELNGREAGARDTHFAGDDRSTSVTPKHLSGFSFLRGFFL